MSQNENNDERCLLKLSPTATASTQVEYWISLQKLYVALAWTDDRVKKKNNTSKVRGGWDQGMEKQIKKDEYKPKEIYTAFGLQAKDIRIKNESGNLKLS